MEYLRVFSREENLKVMPEIIKCLEKIVDIGQWNDMQGAMFSAFNNMGALYASLDVEKNKRIDEKALLQTCEKLFDNFCIGYKSQIEQNYPERRWSDDNNTA